MRQTSMATALLVTALWTGPGSPARGQQPGTQQPQQVEVTVKMELRYLLFLPEDYGKQEDGKQKDKDKRWPMILFLHGAGESGTDLDKVKTHGPPKIVENKRDFPFILVSPQSLRFGWNPEALVQLLDHVVAKYRVDRRRIYLTGLSMGGYGTWSLAAAHPDRFAAIVPICGGGDPDTAKRLRSLPIWVFHGGKDPLVPVSRSQAMVDAIKAAGGNVKLTIYPDAGHDSWTETYDNPKLYEWLLKQKRPEK